MNKKAAIELSVNFLVIIIICIVVFGFSIYIIKRFFTHAETIRMTYDERTEKEIERLLDDGSRVAIPFDEKTIYNGEFKTFGIGIMNTLNIAERNNFRITISFDKAYDKNDVKLCDIRNHDTGNCGEPGTWLQTTAAVGGTVGLFFDKKIKNNEQEKFLLGVDVKNAPSGTYIFNLNVTYLNETDPEPTKWNFVQYDTLHKLYVDVP